MMPAVTQHIAFDKHGRAVIAGTRFRVTMLAGDVRHRKWSAEKIYRSYDGLTLGQIHAALSYYFDHQAAIDEEMDEEHREAEELLKQVVNPELQAKLRRLKREAAKAKSRTRRVTAGK